MVYRYNVEWAIPNAGPSVSVFHFSHAGQQNPQSAVNALRAAFQAIRAYIPDEVTISFPGAFSQLDNRTGQVVGFGAVVAPDPVVGAGTGAWAGGTGLRVQWETDTVARGRRVRGTTYLVPTISSAFTTGGVVSSAASTAVTTAFQTFRSAAEVAGTPVAVYSRPVPTGAGNGHASNALSASVPVRAATLRKRKY